MGAQGTRFEFGVELASQKPRVISKLHDLDENVIRGCSGDDKTFFCQDITECVVELKTVAMPLKDIRLLIGFIREGAGAEMTWIGSQAERSPQRTVFITNLDILFTIIIPFRHEMDDVLVILRRELLRVSMS